MYGVELNGRFILLQLDLLCRSAFSCLPGRIWNLDGGVPESGGGQHILDKWRGHLEMVARTIFEAAPNLLSC